jgi:predicted nucleic acid-binding protein
VSPVALSLLDSLPSVPVLPDDEVRHLIEARELWGKGLGWVDVHLIGSALVGGVALWTADLRLAAAVVELGLASA